MFLHFIQFLYTTKADGSQGIGIFGRIGFADRNTNILEQFYSFGIGGRGMLPGRDHDRFGIGFYYTNFSDDLPRSCSLATRSGWKSFTTSQRPTGSS